MEEKPKKKKKMRSNPVIFPMGFTIGIASPDLLVIDFIDNGLPDEKQVLGSYILPKKAAKDMISGLQEALEAMNDESSD